MATALSEASSTTSSSTATSPAPTSSADDGAISSIVVDTKVLAGGQRIDPGLYQLSGDGRRFGIGYAWSARRSDGTEDTTNNCQITAVIAGNGTSFPAYRTDECTKDFGSPFNSDNGQEIAVPGTYTLTITDQLSGASGVARFTVQ
ncbi:hypothetical protein M1C59_25415 (plasmid) [Gordonia terrae]|uniref:hypothetical protein n=1 Tax=Gordonia terrae TaxID=2055 RepID=UPI00200B0742|nr:hypothetical protein [Gordonia terrae]UPW11993.1 hypothetical protein M1C59_25415 [Gordonia terrae]